MKFIPEPQAIPDVIVIRNGAVSDDRGAFAEVYRASAFEEFGVTAKFVQDNHVSSPRRATLRGLHFQAPPHAQAKLIRVVRGAIFDVSVDIRSGSPTYGAWVGVHLEPGTGQVFVPHGFVHGYCTLSDDTEVIYRCDDYYAPETEGGLRYDDPDLAISWPITSGLTLADRDRELPLLADFRSPFRDYALGA